MWNTKKCVTLSVVYKTLFVFMLFCQHKNVWAMILESCLGQFDVHKNTIIRTGESQAIGGKYLEGVELDTMEECQRLCCETIACDVYIFEAKNDGFCYLFECGTPDNFHCKFTRHANYTSAVLTKPREATTTTTTTTTTSSTTTTTTTTQKPTISSNYSQQELELTSLKGGQQNKIVAEKPAVVQTVQETAHAPQCGRFEFACHSGDCIAVYNACDGIPQCQDGSDEGPECSGAPTSNKSQVVQKKVVVNEEFSTKPLPQAIDNREDHNAWVNRQIVAELQQQAVKGKQNIEQAIVAKNLTHIMPVKTTVAPILRKIDLEEPAHLPENQAADEDYLEKATIRPKKPTEHYKKQHKHKKQPKPVKQASEELEEKPLPPAVHEQHKAIHESLALELRDHDGYSERPGGAVLSLTLGVLVTAALAIIASCRMRTVRRRSRKPGAKSSYGQESDFLVNGMYL